MNILMGIGSILFMCATIIASAAFALKYEKKRH